MLVSPEAEPLVATSLGLLEASDAEGEGFPQLRVGVAGGPALSRAGDWYGRPVNIASRVVQIARAGSVLGTREIRDAAPESYRWSSAGARTIKGVPDPVRLYRARRLGSEQGDAAAGDGRPRGRRRPGRGGGRGRGRRGPGRARRPARAPSRAPGPAPRAGGRGGLGDERLARRGLERGRPRRRPARAAGACGRTASRATAAPRAPQRRSSASSVACSPSASASGPDSASPSGMRPTRHGEVVGAHARDRGGRDLLLDATVSQSVKKARRDAGGRPRASRCRPCRGRCR